VDVHKRGMGSPAHVDRGRVGQKPDFFGHHKWMAPYCATQVLLSSVWVSRTGSASDWCALQKVCIINVFINIFVNIFIELILYSNNYNGFAKYVQACVIIDWWSNAF